ncbi:MAG: capsular polysaccharide synthesis protein [Paludibacteraceae bacterium]|nr:capsular polysaccharide synthesis protein [Paludibacteraceae bacterium]
MMVRTLKTIRHNIQGYGMRVAMVKFVYDMVCLCCIPEKGQKWVYNKYYIPTIYSFLNKKYAPLVEKYKNRPSKNKEGDTIWTMWWQGEENAPELVKSCINSIRRHTDKKVIVLDKDNYIEYISLPSTILEGVKRKRISLTHLSDIIRCGVLSFYGGFWLDATVYVTKDLPENLFSDDFYTHHDRLTDGISRLRWSTFFMGGRDVLLFQFLYDAYIQYWKEMLPKNKIGIIDYFLFDFFIILAYEHLPIIRKEIDSVPLNNPHMHDIEPILLQPYQGFYEDTFAYKLTFRTDTIKEIDGKQTYYGWIVSNR